MQRPEPSSDFTERAAGFVAFALPMLLGVLSAAKEPYWLDAPEFTAAAETLGMPHPPGHPLYVMLTKPFTLLPFGGISFRVSLASAFFGAVASFLLYLICRMLVQTAARGLPRWMGALSALAASVTASVAPGWWFQTVRQETYALQICLVLAALYPFLRYALAPKPSRERLLYVSAFFAGLGITNHHFIMLAAVPAVIPQLTAAAREKGGVGALTLTVKLVGVAAVGLLPYLFLPLRAASGAAVSLGGVHAVGDFFWVLLAKGYQKSVSEDYLASLESNLNTDMTTMGQFGPLILVAAFLGFYLLLRTPRTRMAGLLLTLLVAITWMLRLTMGFDPFTPDYFGYLMPAMAAIAGGFAVFAAVTLYVIRTQIRRGPLVTAVLAVGLAVVPVLRAKHAHPTVDLSTFRATRLFRDFCFDTVTPGSLVLVNYHNLFYTLWSAKFIDGSRPDLTVVNPRLLNYPGYLNAVLRRNEMLAPLARALLVHKNLTESSAAELALSRPMRVEPDLSLDESVVRYMLPAGPLYTASPEPLAPSDVAAASPEHHDAWKTFYSLLGDTWKEPETFRMLSYAHYQDAAFMARRGDRDGAKQAVEMGLSLGKRIPELLWLGERLETTGKDPIDISPLRDRAPLEVSLEEETGTERDTGD